MEHVHTLAAAVHGKDTPESKTLGVELESLLWEGKVDPMIQLVRQRVRPSEKVLPEETVKSPQIFHREPGYFEKHRQHMRYGVYRAKGWPIDSGNTEAGVKTFNKRVKGTEQRWRLPVSRPDIGCHFWQRKYQEFWYACTGNKAV